MQITKSLLAAVLLMGTNVLAAPAPSEAVASLNERAAVDNDVQMVGRDPKDDHWNPNGWKGKGKGKGGKDNGRHDHDHDHDRDHRHRHGEHHDDKWPRGEYGGEEGEHGGEEGEHGGGYSSSRYGGGWGDKREEKRNDEKEEWRHHHHHHHHEGGWGYEGHDD
ncbi:hypothetical protein F4820DRAFT_463425 [Hypoxylon rubiginosum]|uniref:Uncharacterized protein n=1 Tax=Hypoxylon rubiginosum TaxID=110542 RepID=A0ACB9ZCE9_9PEZI|nr:hypothetical protein F4820DRAFT_463425 [Hypoxylon rubiginosum]